MQFSFTRRVTTLLVPMLVAIVFPHWWKATYLAPRQMEGDSGVTCSAQTSYFTLCDFSRTMIA